MATFYLYHVHERVMYSVSCYFGLRYIECILSWIILELIDIAAGTLVTYKRTDLFKPGDI